MPDASADAGDDGSNTKGSTMERALDGAYDWARDAEPIYTFLGIYVAAFQAIEGSLDEILILAGGSDARSATLDRLAAMSNAEKIAAATAAALSQQRFARVHAIPGWAIRIKTLRAALEAERNRRNGILHASYMLRGVELAFDAIRTHRTRKNGKVQSDQDVLGRERMDEILGEIAALSFELGQVRMQILHLADDPPLGMPDGNASVEEVEGRR